MKKALFFSLRVSLYTIGYFFASSGITQAQVTTDDTVNTQVNQNGNVSEITGGETRGSNLFHSFQDFSVSTGNEASFVNADNISSIFSRVTGGNISNIDGTLRANGSASLFLINPAGIIFGENASLDIGGSFYGSSASSILFEDGEFSAADLENPPLLTVNAPIGLGFRDQLGDIVNNSVANSSRGLEVNPGNNISLLGGNISFDGGVVTAPGGVINLGGLSAAGEVILESDNTFDFPSDENKSNISIANNGVLDISSNGGGLIAVDANNLELTGASWFLANISEGLGSENALAGTIEINSNSIAANNNSLIQSDNLGIGQAGTINITTNSFNFTNGSAITATTFGVGNAGTINVTSQDITIDREFSGIYSNVGLTNIASESEESNVEGVIGNGGTININTNTLSLFDGARIISSSIAQGDGGIVNINATGEIIYQGAGETPVPAFGGGTVISGSFSQVQQDGNGNAGEVNITADSLQLIDTGAVLTDNSGVGGDAGDITLNIANNIFLDQTGLILAQIKSGAEGNGGNININSNSLEALGGSFILADTGGVGDAGNININVSENISLDEESIILTEVGEDGIGNAGNITITANSLTIENNADIAAETSGQGNAGNITITTDGAISLEDSGEIRSLVNNGATGNGGNISLTAGELNLTNSSQILADSQATGNGGNITIIVGEQILLEGSPEGGFPSQIVAGLSRENAQGNGGNIKIQAGEIVLDDLASITSNTVSNTIGSAGNITIDANSINLMNNSFINAFTANDSNGGAITIDAQTLNLESGGKILAATDSEGNAGDITLNISEQIQIDNSILSSTEFVDFGEGSQLLNDLQDSSSGIYANATENAAGNGGSINIKTLTEQRLESVVIANDAQIVVNSEGTGSGGNISINSQNLELNNDGLISASTNSGSGGLIDLTIAKNLTLRHGSLVSAEAFNDANSGNLNIDARFIIAFPNQIEGDGSDIVANAQRGNGGNININAESLFGIRERSLNNSTNDINASSQFSLDGNIIINTLDINPIQGATDLPTNIIETREITAPACEANRESVARSGLNITGKGGIPAEPGLPLNSLNITVNGDNNLTSTIPAPIETSRGKIQPARGIKVNESGEITLTAYRTNNAGDRLPEIKPNCGRV